MYYEIFDITVDNEAYVDVACFCSKWLVTSWNFTRLMWVILWGSVQFCISCNVHSTSV